MKATIIIYVLILVERNTIGNNLLDYLFDQLEYENVWFDEKQADGTTDYSQEQRYRFSVEMEEAIQNE